MGTHRTGPGLRRGEHRVWQVVSFLLTAVAFVLPMLNHPWWGALSAFLALACLLRAEPSWWAES